MKMNEKVMLQTKNLSKKFKKDYVVKDLNIEVQQGDIYGFLGPNGAGKTTTLKIILGFLNPTQGEAYIYGKSIKDNKNEILRTVGAMIETPKFYENLTGRKNLQVIAELYGKKAKSRVDEVLEIVEMKDAGDKKVKEYSMGMKQRLGIARAFLNDPQLIILDEPTNGLDPYGMKSIRELIIKLTKKYNKTFIVSTHLLNEVELMCNKVGIIHNGSLIEEIDMIELDKKKSKDISFEDYFISLTQEGRNYV